ncbi:MAG TPA: hypothetical protein VFE60_27745 [Roseiarcus sp.]|nr:hypothetical protein [Roseiarcus sp.]
MFDVDDPRLAGEPLLLNALSYWRKSVPTRRPKCFGCKTVFTVDGAAPRAFLLVTPQSAPTSCSTSALCKQCWATMTDAEIETAAAKALRPVLPSGLR